MPRISLPQLNNSVCSSVLKSDLLLAARQSNVIYVNSYTVSIQQFCFNECCSTACKLIKNPVSFLGIAQ